jgi:class 3 adenylate cyclase
MLLTDVEGSTVLWEDRPEAMRLAMRRHHEIAYELIARYSGYLPPDQGEGDSLFAVFGDAREGVACAVDLQRSLTVEPWPDDVTIRVRAALHTGGRSISAMAVTMLARPSTDAHGCAPSVTAARRFCPRPHGPW